MSDFSPCLQQVRARPMFSTADHIRSDNDPRGSGEIQPLPQQTAPVTPQRLKESVQRKRRGGNERDYVRMSIQIIGPNSATRMLTCATVHPYRIRQERTTPQRRIGWVRRDGGCRDNPQQQMAPRRRGSRVPSLRTVGSLGPRSLSY